MTQTIAQNPALAFAPHSATLSTAEHALLKKAVDERTPLLCIRTGTQVDVGLWLRWRNILICVCENKVVLLADGPRPFCQSAGYDQLGTTFYNHRSSELVLVPAPELLVRSLAVPPDDGWSLLSLIQELSLKHSAAKDTIHASTSH